MIDTFIQDIRYGLRSLFAKPGFLIAAVATLALGIGANTAIFSVINGLLLKPLPYDDGERLVQVHNSYPKTGLDYAGTSIPDYIDRKTQAPALEDLAIYTGESFNLAASGAPQRLVGLKASPSLWTTLRAQAALGRVFGEDEGKLGSEKVAVLAHGTWKSQFAGDASIVGSDVRLNGDNYRILGVMPEGFAFPNRHTQIWVPFALSDEQLLDDERGNEFSESIGRLAPGATVDQLNSQFDAIVQRNAERISGLADPRAAGFSEWLKGGNFFGRAKSLREQWVGDLRPVLWLLQAVVAFVLLIACANVANLMLTRVSARQRELSVRTALGAGRFRIARQLVIESLALSLMGGAAGVLIAYFSLGLLGTLGLDQSELSGQVGIDPAVLAFTLAISVVTGLVFGLVPALAQGGKPYEVLKEGGRGNTIGKGAKATRSALVVVQMALAVTLLVGAGLLIRSFQQVMEEDPGFSRDGLMTVRFDLPSKKYTEAKDRTAFYEGALTGLRAIPGVTAAGYISNLPFGQSNWTSSYDIEGLEIPDGESGPHGFARIVDENFFKAMDIPVLAGRTFLPTDALGTEKVIVIDQLLAQKYFKNESPIGRRIERGEDDDPNRFWTIIGVVGTVKNVNMATEVTKESYYFSYRQVSFGSGFFVVKSALPLGGLVPPIRDAVLRMDPEQPLYDIKSLDERIAISLDTRRAPMLLLAVFAGVALLLAAIGIYGVLAFSVAQRTGELGVRMAIGAQSNDIVGLVLKQGVRLALIGLGIGIVGSLVLTRFMEAQLFNVKSGDPVTMLLVVVVLGAVAMVACWLPARRAAKTSPMAALRYE